MFKKYIEGTFLPPNNIFFKQEIEPKICPSGRKLRRGIFICPYDGTEFVTTLQDIYTGHTTSCGCINKLDLTGQKFGRLLVLERDFNRTDKNNNYYWICQCDCGNTVSVGATYLKNGKSQSCLACAQIEDIKGRRFSKLIPIQFMYQDKIEYVLDNGTVQIFNKKTGFTGAQWICKCDCGNYIIASYNHLVTGHTTSCGCRKQSRGEEKIQSILDELNIEYIPQYNIFSKYRIDFYLPVDKIAIEYDGEQHFRPVNIFGGEEQFILTQARDATKNQYCLNNNIRMVRIPYTELVNLTTSFLYDIIYNNDKRFDIVGREDND